MNNIIFFLFSLLLAIFFIIVGSISSLINWSATIRTSLVQFILEDTTVLTLLGLGFLLIGVAILIHCIYQMKHRSYRIKSGDYSVTVDEAVIETCLNNYWGELFPHQDVASRLILKKNKIAIRAHLPAVPPEQRPKMLSQIKHDLSNLFENILGYSQPFDLSISFQKK